MKANPIASVFRIKKQLIFLPKSQSKGTVASNDAVQHQNNNSSNSQVYQPFKKPTILPANKGMGRTDQHLDSISSSISVEMASSRSETYKLDNLISNESTEVTMLSAKSHDTTSNSAKEPDKENKGVLEKQVDAKATSEASKPSAKKTISETTKMLVRDTILASMLAKKNGNMLNGKCNKKYLTLFDRCQV